LHRAPARRILTDMREWIFAIVAGAIIVAILVYRGLQLEKVGELLVPTTMMGMKLRLTVRRETVSVDHARVHAGISASGGTGLKSLTDQEALQVARWLEEACTRSDTSLGIAGGVEIASNYDGRDYRVEFLQHSGEGVGATLTADQARTVAGWLRTAAAPGRTLAEARRRMPKAPA
jgi:hypothetical protein